MSLHYEQQSAVLSEAKTWLGTPWHHMARIKRAGVDCAMFLAEVYERAGVIPHYEPEPYAADWNMHRSEEKYLDVVKRFADVIDGPPAPGDVVTFKIGRCVSHAAIVIQWPVIIHSCLGQGVVMDDALANQFFAPRIAGFYSYRPL